MVMDFEIVACHGARFWSEQLGKKPSFQRMIEIGRPLFARNLSEVLIVERPSLKSDPERSFLQAGDHVLVRGWRFQLTASILTDILSMEMSQFPSNYARSFSNGGNRYSSDVPNERGQR